MAENDFGNHRKIFEKVEKISKIIFRHGKQYFLFKLSGLAYKKTPEMKELAPNKQTLKI